MERLDTSPDEGYVSCAVYGKSGSGKTSFGVTAPKPLILLSERQGMVHVRQAAKRLGLPVPPVLFMKTVQDYRNVARALHGSKQKPFQVTTVVEEDGKKFRKPVFEMPEWPETVVLDSVTDACRIIVEEIREQSPPKIGKDGLPVDSERFWNVLGDRAMNLVLSFRDAPVHKVFLALADDRSIEDAGVTRRQLTLNLPMRKLPEVVTAAVNLVGYAYRKESRKLVDGKQVTKLVYGVMLSGPEFMTLKPCAPLRSVEVPNFTAWVETIHGAAPPAAPEASDESLLAASEEARESDEVRQAELLNAFAKDAIAVAAGEQPQIAPPAPEQPSDAPEEPELPPAPAPSGRKAAGGRRRAAEAS